MDLVPLSYNIYISLDMFKKSINHGKVNIVINDIVFVLGIRKVFKSLHYFLITLRVI